MSILASQRNQLFDAIDESPFERAEFVIDEGSGRPIVRHVRAPTRDFFFVKDWSTNGEIFGVEYSPGALLLREATNVDRWQGVVSEFRSWLSRLQRELGEAERAGVSVDCPEWALRALPSRYADIKRQLGELAEAERRLVRMTGLLYQTGDPLNRLVRDAFRSLKFEAEGTIAGGTYDITVMNPSKGRLLIEVTGIEGQLTKGTKKINQVLQAIQKEATAADRVCVAVNAYRNEPLDTRAALELATPEALALLTGLNAIVFATTDLFALWKQGLDDVEGARKAVLRLADAPAGVVKLT